MKSIKGREWLKKNREFVAFGAAVVLLLAIFCNWRPVRHPATQEYIIGSGNCKGGVNTERFLAESPAFAIGADEDGWAVFKHPNKALFVLKMKYSKGIRLMRSEWNILVPLTPWTYQTYNPGGADVSHADQEAYEQARFVMSFWDIYENSFPWM